MKKVFLSLAMAVVSISAFAQEQAATVVAPFVNIAQDARSTGMGNVGAATQGDVYSMYWNASKYAMAQDQFGVGLSATPMWLNEVESGLNLVALNAYYQISPKAGTVAIGARYFTNPAFNLGDVKHKQGNDFSIDLAYAYKIGDKFSVALAGRYISFTSFGADFNSVRNNAFAGDISASYQDKKQTQGGRMINWGVGLNASNLSSKVKVNDSENFLPANIRLGGAFGLELCPKNSLQFAADFSKLLVPTASDMSIGDAFNNMKDIIYSVGAEYSYNNWVFGRVGYSYQDENQGAMQLVTLGVGGRYAGFGLDASYWIPTVKNSPLKNTFRISLSYGF